MTTSLVDQIIDNALTRTGSLISILEDLQSHYHYLDQEAMERVSQRTGFSLSQIYGVATFYNAFTFRPSGRYVVRVCTGTACHVNGGDAVLDEIERFLEITAGETTEDGRFTLECVNCLGSCAIGPVVVVNRDYHGTMNAPKVRGLLERLRREEEEVLLVGESGSEDLRRVQETVRLTTLSDFDECVTRLRSERSPDKPCISLCGGPGCRPRNGGAITAAFRQAIEASGLCGTVDFRMTGCHGFCEQGPVVVISPGDVFYRRVTPQDAGSIVASLHDGQVVDRLLYVDPETGDRIHNEHNLPFYARQKTRMFLAENRFIDPTSIEDALVRGGYGALRRLLEEMTPEMVIDEIRRAGLRGRGGAGFPTAAKWEACRRAEGHPKYVICNADEGDPGAYQDRSILEGDPHSIIEGMAVGAYAIGAEFGIIYVREEYPLAVKHLSLAVERARDYGLLGQNIMGTGFTFDVEIVRGAGAFVCGEETALIASIEGRRGTPRSRPPFPVTSGLYKKPTTINNVKTWKAVKVIMDRGAGWFTQTGTERCRGTMLFSLVGKIRNAGLVEVPMGVTLRELIHDIGGGIPDGKALKAVQTGGPSGGCLPASLLDLSIDYEALASAGSIVGSGGIIVMDEATCMVDVARYFVHFTQDESCGKCVPCQMGTAHLSRIFDRIVAGDGTPEDIGRLKRLAWTMQNGSLCGLGRTAPNPVLTTLRYFFDEYEAHIVEKRCPALVCKGLITYWIDPDLCVGCSLCRKNCSTGAIMGEHKKLHVIDHARCVKCGVCFEVCPRKIGAVKKLTGKNSLIRIRYQAKYDDECCFSK
jgi:NADH-quinone oxidoreductase subunit F